MVVVLVVVVEASLEEVGLVAVSVAAVSLVEELEVVGNIKKIYHNTLKYIIIDFY